MLRVILIASMLLGSPVVFAASQSDCTAAAKNLNKLRPKKNKFKGGQLKQWIAGCMNGMSEQEAKCLAKAKSSKDVGECSK